jgi:hypothetical protein
MRIKLLAAAILTSAIPTIAGTAAAPVGVRMRHLVLHMSPGVTLQVDDLRGRLDSRTAAAPVFDDVNSYLVAVDYAKVAMSADSLTHLMNDHVFAADDAPVKNVAIRVEDGQLVQSGVLKKGVSVPFTLRATVAVAPDGRLRMHPTSLKAAGFLSKRVLDFFGLDLEKLLSTKHVTGLSVDGDDLLLDPTAILPPPRMQGRLTRASIERGQLWLQFGDSAAKTIEPPARRDGNYMYYRGDTLRFGKLTMNDADLLLTDNDPRDPFDFAPQAYRTQLVAGYSKNTNAGGLIVYMPDANDLKAGPRKPS